MIIGFVVFVEEGKEGFEGDLGGRLLFGEDTEVVVVGGDLGSCFS